MLFSVAVHMSGIFFSALLLRVDELPAAQYLCRLPQLFLPFPHLFFHVNRQLRGDRRRPQS